MIEGRLFSIISTTTPVPGTGDSNNAQEKQHGLEGELENAMAESLLQMVHGTDESSEQRHGKNSIIGCANLFLLFRETCSLELAFPVIDLFSLLLLLFVLPTLMCFPDFHLFSRL